MILLPKTTFSIKPVVFRLLLTPAHFRHMASPGRRSGSQRLAGAEKRAPNLVDDVTFLFNSSRLLKVRNLDQSINHGSDSHTVPAWTKRQMKKLILESGHVRVHITVSFKARLTKFISSSPKRTYGADMSKVISIHRIGVPTPLRVEAAPEFC